MTRGIWALGSLLACCAALAFPALSAPSVTTAPVQEGTALAVGGRIVGIFHVSNAGLSARQRAEKAAERLRQRLGEGLRPDQVEARSRGKTWGVYAGESLLMIATPEEAAERNATPESTARRWAANLRKVLAQGGSDPGPGAPAKPAAKAAPALEEKPVPEKPAVPTGLVPAPAAPLEVGDQSLAVPVGETRLAPVSGGAGPLSARSEDPRIATARVVRGRTVEVRGLVPGRTVVRVGRGSQERALTVWVKKYAGRVAGIAEAEVTGSPAPASLVREAAVRQALAGTEREPGAVLQLTGEPQGVRSLGRGESAEVSFPFTLTGEGLLPVRSAARVRVKNVALPEEEAQTLLYSNDPESVRQFQTLYFGLVGEAAPVRLLYHHQNRMGRPLMFQVHLLNPGDAPVEVQVIEADAGPHDDPIQVGHRAGQRYLAASMQDVGYVARVQARGSHLIYNVAVPDLQTVSGIYNLRVLRGGPLVAHVSAAGDVTAPAVTPDLLDAARAEPHTYQRPQKVEQYRYTVGERWAFVPLGRKALKSRDANRTLFGNYGVIYKIQVDLSNPTNETQTIRVLMSPDAGWARGVFVIEGKIVEAPQVAPPQEALLWKVNLAPGEQRSLNIQGIPVGGSNYPISLVVRS